MVPPLPSRAPLIDRSATARHAQPAALPTGISTFSGSCLTCSSETGSEEVAAHSELRCKPPQKCRSASPSSFLLTNNQPLGTKNDSAVQHAARCKMSFLPPPCDFAPANFLRTPHRSRYSQTLPKSSPRSIFPDTRCRVSTSYPPNSGLRSS